MHVIINPGAGPVPGATLEHAEENLRHFLTDLGGEHVHSVRIPDLDEDGRFGFLIWQGQRCHEIEMPGLPIEHVRYLGDGQNIWAYPRLYVDGGSWVWKFALGVAAWEDEE